jgi:hypothetical protein
MTTCVTSSDEKFIQADVLLVFDPKALLAARGRVFGYARRHVRNTVKP